MEYLCSHVLFVKTRQGPGLCTGFERCDKHLVEACFLVYTQEQS